MATVARGLYVGFTDKARRAVVHAMKEASRREEISVSLGHLIIGILVVGPVYIHETFHSLKLTPISLFSTVTALLPPMININVVEKQVPLSAESQHVLEEARKLAEHMEHESVTLAHLFFQVLFVGANSSVIRALNDQGITTDRVVGDLRLTYQHNKNI